jgi:hypothetical protein
MRHMGNLPFLAIISSVKTIIKRKMIMKHYVGLDMSQEEPHVCVINADDRKIWQGKCESTPEAIGKLIKEYAHDASKIGLEAVEAVFCCRDQVVLHRKPKAFGPVRNFVSAVRRSRRCSPSAFGLGIRLQSDSVPASNV